MIRNRVDFCHNRGVQEFTIDSLVALQVRSVRNLRGLGVSVERVDGWRVRLSFPREVAGSVLCLLQSAEGLLSGDPGAAAAVNRTIWELRAANPDLFSTAPFVIPQREA